MTNINLLPWRTEEIFYKNNIFFAICVVIATTMLALIIMLNIFFKILSSHKLKEIEKLDEKISFYQSKTKEITGLKERKKLLLGRLSIINDLQSQRAIMVDVLNKIANAIPNGIALKQMDLKGNVLSLSANSESNSRISEFMRNLEKTSILVSPKLKEIKSAQNNNGLIEFNLEINIVTATN